MASRIDVKLLTESFQGTSKDEFIQIYLICLKTFNIKYVEYIQGRVKLRDYREGKWERKNQVLKSIHFDNPQVVMS